MFYSHPDTLFQTRGGVTPHVLWGVPFCESFFGNAIKDFESPARKWMYALFRLVTDSETPNSEPNPILKSERTERILEIAVQNEKMPVGCFPILALARGLAALEEKEYVSESEAAVWREELLKIAQESCALEFEKEPLGYLLLAGELAFTLAYVMSRDAEVKMTAKDAKMVKSLRKQAQKVLSETLSEYLDGGGTPKAEWLPLFRMFAASWTRMRLMDAEILKQNSGETSIFDSDSRSNFEWMTRMLLYFTRPDGSMVFTKREKKTAFWCPELFVAALRLDSDEEDKKLALSIWPERNEKDLVKIVTKLQESLPDCSNNSPWGRAALMQKSWRSRTSVTLTWEREFPQVEILSRKTPLFSGEWRFDGLWNGSELRADGSWRQVCWNSDEDADYVELELPLTEGFTLQRSVLLAKEEHFVLLGEALSGDRFRGKNVLDGELRWRSFLPLAAHTQTSGSEENLELFLQSGGSPRATLLPLALPEWQCQTSDGQGVFSDSSTVCVTYSMGKSAFFAPIFLDLEPQRLHSALTWRRLSVGEKLQNIPAHTASGFRVQIDDSQWLVYRSLTPPCGRSVLGKNLNSETLVGKFCSDGNVKSIVEVEP